MEKSIEEIAKQTDITTSEADLCKERLGEVRTLVLESVKKRWIRSGRRDSTASQMSRLSKRDREEDIMARKDSRLRVSPPASLQ